MSSPQTATVGTAAGATTAATTRTATVLQALMAAALGLVLLAGVGFAQIPALHNAAHDTRHSTGFPCH